MNLPLKQIASITRGAVNVCFEDGAYRFYRMTEGEFNPPDKSIADATAGIVLEFKTDADNPKLKLSTKVSMDIRSFFSFKIVLLSVK